MAITERIKQLVRGSSAICGGDNDLFLTREVFRRIIDRERDRTNRMGDVFSLVIFVLPSKSQNYADVKVLADSLSEQIRSIDAVGWLDSHHVGILLPETSSTGAYKFANKIYQQILLIRPPPNYEVCTYPSDRLTDPEKIALHVVSGKAAQKQNGTQRRGGWPIAKSQRSVDFAFYLTKRILKRGFDIFGASVGLLILSPLFLVITGVIRVVSPGPVFYKQPRIGYAGQPFTFLKFRTMHPNSDNREHQNYLAQLIKSEAAGDGAGVPMAKLDHDPQIIPFGSLLRKSCLDELPQLINVLHGEMSLVGPRPPIPYEVKEYLSWHRGRFDAVPGMTGLWQVSGKNKLSFREMVRLDIRYARDRSLWGDIKILIRTPLAILEQIKDSLDKNNSTINERG